MEEKLERREYFRIKDVLQIGVKRFPQSEIVPMARIVGYPGSFRSSEINVPPDTVDPFIVRQLQAIHQKLDSILEHLCLDRFGFADLQYSEVDLSAGGIRIKTTEAFNEGDNAEIRMVLPTAPPLYLICYGKVRRCSNCADQREVAVEFVNISEEIRSLIMKYVLQRQRQDIRR